MTEKSELRVVSAGSYRFAQSGRSTSTENMGMREMQQRVFSQREARLLLIKAPPASGKSRALMYLALDKLFHQGIKKVIIAVPQMAIGPSFRNTELKSRGFFADWKVDYDLCVPGADVRKSEQVREFMQNPDARILLCAHPTLVYFYNELKDKTLLNHTLVAVDEFHHVSSEEGSRLGAVIHSLIHDTTAHLTAMTGSYFRGDSEPVLLPEDERLFRMVTYTYYEQLNGYKYLKKLNINYAFYTGKWTDSIAKLLDINKKTIIYIPPTNSRETIGDKINETGKIIDLIGKSSLRDDRTGIYTVTTAEGKAVRVADLVTEQQHDTLAYLRTVRNRDDVDIIIAMNMAKEGFDWPWCEQVLAVGYRNSLTEVVQIIGRATRDCEGKTEASFTNLIARPDASQQDAGDAVNTLLKAITLSLLMQQVLLPNVHFRARSERDAAPQDPAGVTCTIADEIYDQLSPEAKGLLEAGMDDIMTKVVTSSPNLAAAVLDNARNCDINVLRADIEKFLRQGNPELTDYDYTVLTDAMMGKLSLSPSGATGDDATANGEESGDSAAAIVPGQSSNAMLMVGDKFINVNELDMDLIAETRPFFNAYAFLSRALDKDAFQFIQDAIIAKRSKVTQEDALRMWKYILKFVDEHKREPSPNAIRDDERYMAEVLAYLRHQKAEKLAEQKQELN